MKPSAIALTAGLFAACGRGPSGVDSDMSWDEVTEQEMERFCEWGVELLGGEGYEEQCDEEGISVQVPSVDDCVEEVGYLGGCDLLVSDLEACYQARAQGLCDRGGDTCDPYYDCLMSGR